MALAKRVLVGLLALGLALPAIADIRIVTRNQNNTNNVAEMAATAVTGCQNEVLYGDNSQVLGCEAALGYNAGTNTLTAGVLASSGAITAVTSVTGATIVGSTSVSTPSYILTGANGGLWTAGIASEALTLDTGAAFTDTVANLLPANSIIEAVTYRITTSITTSANFTIGVVGTTNRFCSTQSTLTAGTTGVCLVQWTTVVGGDLGVVQAAAAKVRVTLNAAPGAGVIRLQVHYRTFTPPTS